MLIFQRKPVLIACDDVTKMASRHDVQHAKKPGVLQDPRLLQIICQLMWDPPEMKIFHSERVV
jgi:hypothetical protein